MSGPGLAPARMHQALAAATGSGAEPAILAPGNFVTAGYLQLEHAFDTAFGAALNPLKHLGAIAFLLFWLLALSGIILYVVIDTSAQGAYRSIDQLARAPLGLGSVLRGLHRYGADAFVLVMLAHLAREWLRGRYAGFRRFTWLTGVPLLPLAFVCGIGGFWLCWDVLAQFSATATAEWLDALPVFSTPLARNFLAGGHLSDRLFSLLVFVHLGLPLLLVFGLWVHIQRLSRAEVFPPWATALGTVLALLGLAAALPVRSQGPADLAVVPASVALDWILLFVHPLTAAISAQGVWALLGAALLLLFALPAFSRRALAPVVVVDPANCNGCRRCFDDCPYAAIAMVPHPNGRRGAQLAQVRPELCARCGICVGACPSSTPFRSTEVLLTGIDMPHMPIDALRRRLAQALSARPAGSCIVVFGCNHGARVAAVAGADVLSFSLECIGMLAPSFIDYALRDGAMGVLVSGCREGGCEYRLGQRWTAQRLHGEREPHLRESVPRRSWNVAWADAGDEATLRAALDRLRADAAAGAAPPAIEASA